MAEKKIQPTNPAVATSEAKSAEDEKASPSTRKTADASHRSRKSGRKSGRKTNAAGHYI